MAVRKIIEIDRDLCDGCGLCTDACAEGALVLDDENKAVLVKEIYCDGMGACLDVCPIDALKIIERESDEYDAQATFKHVLATRGEEAAEHVHGIGHGHGHDDEASQPVKREPAPHFPQGCPGSMSRDIQRESAPAAQKTVSGVSELSQWPIQLHLVSPFAPYFNESDLLVAADCTAFALGSFHQDLLKGKKLIIACPKLDDTSPYIQKLSEILKNNTIYSLTVATMVVPCCAGLEHMVDRAVEESGVSINVKKIKIGIDGQQMAQQTA